MVSTVVHVEPNPHALLNGLKRNGDRRIQTTLPRRCNLAERSPGEPFWDIFDWWEMSLTLRNTETAHFTYGMGGYQPSTFRV